LKLYKKEEELATYTEELAVLDEKRNVTEKER